MWVDRDAHRGHVLRGREGGGNTNAVMSQSHLHDSVHLYFVHKICDFVINTQSCMYSHI